MIPRLIHFNNKLTGAPMCLSMGKNKSMNFKKCSSNVNPKELNCHKQLNQTYINIQFSYTGCCWFSFGEVVCWCLPCILWCLYIYACILCAIRMTGGSVSNCVCVFRHFLSNNSLSPLFLLHEPWHGISDLVPSQHL